MSDEGRGVSALHQAVARAIADHTYGNDREVRAAAAAAVGVVLAEARRSVEVLPAPYWPYDAAAASTGWDMHESAALAALAALAEDEA